MRRTSPGAPAASGAGRRRATMPDRRPPMRIAIAARRVLAPCVVVAVAGAAIAGESREEKVRHDKERVEAAGYWIYGDFAKARAEAEASGKPLVVALRCIPCEECVKLDDEAV